MLVAICLVSCDPGGIYRYELDNRSSKELDVTYLLNHDSDTQYVYLPSNTKMMIREFKTINGIYDFDDEFLNRFFSLYNIAPADSSVLIKDCLLRQNWNYEPIVGGRLGFKKYGENVYTLELVEGDFR